MGQPVERAQPIGLSLVDDEKPARRRLAELLRREPDVEVTGEAVQPPPAAPVEGSGETPAAEAPTPLTLDDAATRSLSIRTP